MFRHHHPWTRNVPSLVLAAAWLLAPLAAGALLAPPSAHAQAGIEAAGLTKGAADWKDRKRSTDKKPVTTAPASGANPAIAPRVQGRATTPEPVRVPRKPSGAPGTVAGRVVERRSNAPVPGVLLSLTSTEQQYVIERLLARTDSTGRYQFADVEPGRWSLVVIADRLPATYSARADERIVPVAKSQKVEVLPFALGRTACVQGHITWSDGYVFSDATSSIFVSPLDSSLGAARGPVNGVGDFELCSAPADSAMVWLFLRDGRRLGRPARLAVGQETRIDFEPVPLELMDGTVLQVQGRTPGGLPVPRAEVVIVGRKYGPGEHTLTVFTRQANADHGGMAEVRLPYGVYEVLVMNPREGTWGRVEQLVIAPGAPARVPQEVVLRGSSTPAQRVAWRDDLLARGDSFLRTWRP